MYKRFKLFITNLVLVLYVFSIANFGIAANSQLTLQGNPLNENVNSVFSSVYATATSTEISYTHTPTLTPTASVQMNPYILPENLNVTKSIIHPNKPIIYATDSTNKKLYSFNFETQQTSAYSFDKIPERMTISNNELYVTLTQGHEYVWDENSQRGSIAILDADTLTLKDTLNITIDPYDIIVDNDGYIYVTGGSDQWTTMKSFSRTSKQEISSTGIRAWSFAQLNQPLNRIYTVTTDTSPRDYNAYNISKGTFLDPSYPGGYDSPYHGDYSLNTNFKVSPDGKYLFNGSGVIFTCDPTKSNDMRFYFMLNKRFSDITFDISNNRFFTYTGNNLIYCYRYSDFEGVSTLAAKGDILNMFYFNNQIIAISKDQSNKMFIEKIDTTVTPNYTPMPTPTASLGTAIATPTQGIIDHLDTNISVTKAKMDPEKNILYLIDSTNNKVALADLKTGNVKTIEKTYSPNSLDYFNNELFVGYGAQGKIEVYNANDLTYKEQILTGSNFYDMCIGSDGYIYLSTYDSVIGLSRTSKQQVSSIHALYDTGLMAKNPLRNTVYMTNTGSSPSDIYAFSYQNGQVSNLHESPYHGDYSMASVNKISPDGNFIFNSSGNIFISSSNPAYDIQYSSNLGSSFTDLCFGKEKVFLTDGVSNSIKVYDYNSLNVTDNLNIGQPSKFIFYNQDKLISVGDNRIKLIECSGNTTSPTVTSTPAPGIMLPKGAIITDTVKDPLKPVIYMADAANSRVYAVNCGTNSVAEIQLNKPIEKLDLGINELYVTLVNGFHNSYNFGQQSGEIAVIDTETMTLKSQFKIDTDPYDVASDKKGYIYVPSGSGQWTDIKSYSLISKQMLGSSGIRQMSYAEYNAALNRVYTIDTDSSPRDYEAYDVIDGQFKGSHDSPYHGDYDLSTYFKISPDGNYLFNGSGVIFKCNQTVQDDMKFFFMLNKPFIDIDFDIKNNKFYTLVQNNTIYVYNYTTMEGVDTIYSDSTISKLFICNNNLLALAKNDQNQLYVKVIKTNLSGNTSTPTPTATPITTPTPTSTPTITPINTPFMKLDLNYNVKESFMLKESNSIYIIDNLNNKIAWINYITGETKEITTFYSPSSIAYFNNQIFVGFGQQGYVGIYDAKTLDFIDKVITGCTFFDMNVGSDGFIYTSSSDYLRSFSRTTKQEVSSNYVFEEGYLEMNPTYNNMYFTSLFVSPSDIYECSYDNGIIVGHYDSPYHGDYSIGERNRISPDGNYIFNSSGNIFALKPGQSTDLKFNFKLNKYFNDVTFDMDQKRFYTGIQGKMIYVYDYNTFEGIDTIYTKGNVQDMYLDKNKIISVSKSDDGKYFIEIINTSNNTPSPTPTPTPSIGFKLSGYINPDFVEVLNPSKVKEGFKVQIAETGQTAYTNDSGYFEILNVKKAVPFTLNISKTNYLSRKISYAGILSDVSISSTTYPIEMWAGDVTINNSQDGVINILDIVEVAKSFNTAKGNSNFNINVDFNQDNTINMLDIIIIAKNFNQTSMNYPSIK